MIFQQIKLSIISIIFSLASLDFALAADSTKGAEIYKSVCLQCHGEAAMGLEEKNAPKIAGQFDWYIVSSIQAFLKKERKNPEMLPFIQKLSEAEIEDVALYLSNLAVSSEAKGSMESN